MNPQGPPSSAIASRPRLVIMALLLACWTSSFGAAAVDTPDGAARSLQFDLTGQRTNESRHYLLETHLLHYESDGARRPGLTLRLYLAAETDQQRSDGKVVEYRCLRFTVAQPNGPEVELPTLAGFAYSFDQDQEGIDAKGQVFGIPHSKFAMLVDARGDLVDAMTGYMAYNTFIDFHALNDVFASQSDGSKAGLARLRKVGDSVVHAAAESVAPVHLGSAIKEGSVFRNGRVTLELKGLSEVEGRPSALLGYDSGESSFLMMVEAMPGFATRTEGASHYFGDLYLDLETLWLNKATLREIVVSQTKTGRKEAQSSVLERTLLLRSLSKQEMHDSTRSSR